MRYSFILVLFKYCNVNCYSFILDGKLKSRIADYKKILKSLDFQFLKESVYEQLNTEENVYNIFSKSFDNSLKKLKKKNCLQPIKRAANIFWFGDLNFRIQEKPELKDIENKLYKRTFDYQLLLEYDQLNIERNKG